MYARWCIGPGVGSRYGRARAMRKYGDGAARVPEGWPKLHYSREFVANPLRRDARRARGGRGTDTLPRVFVGVRPRPNGTGTVADDGACPHGSMLGD
jgi:hypothetical protein